MVRINISRPGATRSVAFFLPCMMALGALSFGQTPAQWVDAHNNYRRNLIGFDGNPTSSPDLAWSDALAKDAQEWATKLAASGEIKHRPNSGPDARPWGENIGYELDSSRTVTGLDSLTNWYNEKPAFLPATSKCSVGNECGHFTQVISQLSREVGCATATGSDMSVWAVCNYSPHGNLQEKGAYAELYKNQRPPPPGGAVFANLKTKMQLDLVFNQCLLDTATGLLAAPPASPQVPANLAATCGFATVRAYDSGLGASGNFPNADVAGADVINLYFDGKVMGVNGAVVVSLNPLRAVLITGE